MEVIKCRTCLRICEKSDCVDITDKWCPDQSIKQALIRLIPKMVLTLCDGEMVCQKCLQSLDICEKFIRTCLTVEDILKHDRKLLEVPPEIGMEELKVEVDDTEHYLIQIDSDHNYSIKQEVLDSVSISSGDNELDTNHSKEIKLIDKFEGSEDESGLSLPLKTLVEEPLVEELAQNEKEEKILFEISESPEDLASDEEENEHMKDEDEEFYDLECLENFANKAKNKRWKEYSVLVCQYCGKTFFNKAAWHSHQKIHNENTVKLCEICGKTLKGTRSLQMHITALHEEPSLHICDRCPKSFKHKYKVNLHVKEVHDKVRQQQCTACGRLFANMERCKSHYKLVHLKLKPYVCTICGKKYGRKDYLDKHKLDHAGVTKSGEKKKVRKIPKHGVRLRNPGKPVICRVCGKVIASVHLLKAHLENHVTIKRYKCKYCELTFSMPTNRTRHEKLHESDTENKFRCNICWRRMKTREELDQHVGSHVRPPRHSCDECGEKFHRRYLLKNHIAEKHTSVEDIEKAVEEIVVKNLLEYGYAKTK